MARKVYNHEIAQQFIEHDDYKDNLLYHRGYQTFYLYKDNHYHLLDKNNFRLMVKKFIQANFPSINITMGLVDDITKQIALECLKQIDEEDLNYIVFKDCILNLNSFITEPHNKEITALFYLNFNFDKTKMPIPKFEQFLNTSLVKKENNKEADKGLISLLQEIMGYFLLNNLKAEKAFFFIGQGANGKSRLVGLLTSIFGGATGIYVSAMSIQSLTTDKFKVHHLIGKKINISTEEESKYIETSMFKSLVSGDIVDAQRKFEDSFQFEPKAKFLFCTNNMPTFRDSSYGMVRRIIIVPFYRVFKPEEQDRFLSEKLKKEIPGVVGWAIEGAKRLIENNYNFTDTKAVRQALAEFEDELSSVVRYIRENYRLEDASFISQEYLYTGYKQWCEQTGKKNVNYYNFLKEVRLMAGIKRKHGRIDEGVKRGFNLIEKKIKENLHEILFSEKNKVGGKEVDFNETH